VPLDEVVPDEAPDEPPDDEEGPPSVSLLDVLFTVHPFTRQAAPSAVAARNVAVIVLALNFMGSFLRFVSRL
jgi:hypothetical protein